MKLKRTSPKGTKLPTGAATRQAILDNLPATARKITDLTGRNFSTITATITLMARAGIIVEDENRAPVKGGGTPQKIWINADKSEAAQHQYSAASVFEWRRPGIDSPLPLNHGIRDSRR